MPNSSLRRPAWPRFLRSPGQRLVGVFALFILLPGAFLGVFALRVLRQESQLVRQRTRESLERTAEEIGRDLDAEFRRVSAQGGEPLQLDLSDGEIQDFTLHPDNRRFAFSVDEGSKSELWVMENFLPAPKVTK